MAIAWHPSPNFANRHEKIEYIILHGTWMTDDKSALKRLCDPVAEVSCHYYIDYSGNLLQLVKDSDCAWHAGRSAWKDIESLNQHSIGIEIANPGEDARRPYLETQYQTLEALLKKLIKEHQIKPEDVIGHSDIAPWRKTDPGKHFDWHLLEKKGLAAKWQWPDTAATEEDALYHYGYHGDLHDVVAAFQRRFVPNNVTGKLCDKTRAFMRAGI